MVQVEQGSTFFASQDGYDYGYDAAVFYLLGEIDLADVGLTGIDQSVRQPFNGTPQENLDNKCSRSIMPTQAVRRGVFRWRERHLLFVNVQFRLLNQLVFLKFTLVHRR